MPRLLLFVLAFLALASDASARIRHINSWSVDGRFEHLTDATVGPDGDVYVAVTQDSLEGGNRVARLLRVFRFRPGGELVWRQTIVSDFTIITPGRLAGLKDGGVALCATIYNRVVAGPIVVQPDGVDFFVTVIDGDGAFAWAKSFGSAAQQNGHDIAVMPDGDLIVSGNAFGDIDFGGGTLRSQGVYDAVLARLAADASHVWSRMYGFSNSQLISHVAVSPGGDIAMAGGVGPVDFGGGVRNGGSFVAILDENANHRYSVALGGTGTSQVRGLAFGASGLAVVTGAQSGPVDFGDGVVRAGSNLFMAAYDSNGVQWVHTWSVDAAVFGLEATPEGALFAVGSYDDAITIAPEETPPGSTLLIEFDEGGNPLTAPGFGQPGGTGLPSIGVDAEGGIAIAGLFHMPVDFGSGVLKPIDPLALFVARFELWQPLSIRVVDFGAHLTSQGVEVYWTIESDEALGTYRLRRQTNGNSARELVVFGDAAIGTSAFVDQDLASGHVYTYDLVVSNQYGEELVTAPVTIRLGRQPTTHIEQNLPNPFNPVTSIAYSLASPGRVQLAIYDVDGALVRRLDQGEQAAGSHTVYWNGFDAAGRAVASGVYFYRLEGDVTTPARRMVLLR